MTQDHGTVNFMWLGTAAVLISDGDTGILIDPYVSRFGLIKIALGFPLRPKREAAKKLAVELGGNRIQAVVVSHSHFDHSIDAPYFAGETGAFLFGSPSTLNVGRGAGLPEHFLKKINTKDTIKAGAFTLKFIESHHGPALFGRVPYPGTIDHPLTGLHPAKDYKLGQTYAVVISHPSGTIVHHGSAGFIPGMYEGVTADVVLLGIAGRGDTRTYLENVPLKMKAKTVIPIHFDNFFAPLTKKIKNLPGVKMKEFLSEVQKHGKSFELRIPSMGKKEQILGGLRQQS